jgi:hypothetical protein
MSGPKVVVRGDRSSISHLISSLIIGLATLNVLITLSVASLCGTFPEALFVFCAIVFGMCTEDKEKSSSSDDKAKDEKAKDEL